MEIHLFQKLGTALGVLHESLNIHINIKTQCLEYSRRFTAPLKWGWACNCFAQNSPNLLLLPVSQIMWTPYLKTTQVKKTYPFFILIFFLVKNVFAFLLKLLLSNGKKWRCEQWTNINEGEEISIWGYHHCCQTLL